MFILKPFGNFIDFAKSLGFGENHLKTLMRGFDQALSYILTDSTGQIVYLNSSATKLLGFKTNEVKGKQITDLCLEQNEVRERWLQSSSASETRSLSPMEFFLATAKKKGRDDQDWSGIKKNGNKFPLGTSVIAIFDEQKNVLSYLILIKDLTEKKKMDNLLEEQQLRLASASKFASLGEMAGGVAHEINNPLQIIVGKVEKIRREINLSNLDQSVLMVDIEKIGNTAERIAKIIRGMKTFSRNAEKDPFDKVNIQSVILETLDFCAGRFRDSEVDLRVGQIPEIFIECRAMEISQVLLNLLNNSLDAVHSLAEKWVAIELEIGQENIVISVTDSGAGISNAIADRIMEPFFTTKGVRSGTGLGLSISLGIIEKHNGTFELNRQSTNTQFVINLPIHQSNPSAKSA